MSLLVIAAIEGILKLVLIPLLGAIEDELISTGCVSQETADEYHEHLMSVMRFVVPFLPMATQVLQKEAPSLLPVLDWAKDRYQQSENNSSSK